MLKKPICCWVFNEGCLWILSKKTENLGFVCGNCGAVVMSLDNGSFRNHCPVCLYSKHVDNQPGDRLAECGGLMKPIDVLVTSKKGLQIVHKCLACGAEKVNKVAEDANQCDDYQKILNVMNGMG
ncbi:MAG: RNHCP domain-containing protein [Oscillospiraceae bacterium]|nr:RNHCP domain-containing protein [Oscillospiraceae bacterium]